jgi:hypothetical protein
MSIFRVFYSAVVFVICFSVGLAYSSINKERDDKMTIVTESIIAELDEVDLIGGSTLIATGRAGRENAVIRLADNVIVTDYTFVPDNVFYGDVKPGQPVIVRSYFGEVDNLVAADINQPTFNSDERYLLFLRNDDAIVPWSTSGYYLVTGSYQGQYTQKGTVFLPARPEEIPDGKRAEYSESMLPIIIDNSIEQYKIREVNRISKDDIRKMTIEEIGGK